MTRVRVADEEELDKDNPLLLALLQDLPCQEHPNASWRAAGEKEYYCTRTARMDATEDQEKKDPTTPRRGKVKQRERLQG